MLERDLEDALEVERVLGAAADEPARRVAEAAHVRVAQRLLDALGHLASRHPLAAVHARLHPVELGEHVVGEVEPAVGEDVALDPAQDAERREQLVGGGDLLGLAADVVGGEPADGADGRRVVADREVLVAALAGGAAHLLDARAAVRPRRVAVQVAADVASSSTSAGGSPRNGSSRSSGGHHGHAERRGRRPPRRARRAAARARATYAGRAGRAHERGPEALAARRRRARPARPRPSRPTARRSLLLDHRDDLRQRGEAREHRPRVRRRRRPPRAARTSRASAARRRRPRRRARAAMPPTSSRARLSSSPRCGRGSASRASASSSRASVFGPMPGHGPQPPGGRRLAQLARACGRRAPARSRPSAWR